VMLWMLSTLVGVGSRSSEERGRVRRRDAAEHVL
jgi:hypothetical protein